jgi:TRAP transporter 4TM/12TM fusion protein
MLGGLFRAIAGILRSREAQSADEYLKEERAEIRIVRPLEQYLIAALGIGWALFQLALPSVIVVDSTRSRAIHLAFAMALVFLLLPALRKPRKHLSYLSITDRVPLLDYALGAGGALSALYLAVYFDEIGMRSGSPTGMDLLTGVTLVLLLLEATRRIMGPILPVIALLFTGYAFLGPWMPDVLSHRGVTLGKYLSNITLSTEGIYGIPLGVSSSIVFLFVLLGALMDCAGAGRFFTNLALSFLGPFKGGAAKAAIAASGATGMVSGSSIANIVTTGPFTIPLMKKVGYPAHKAAAIEVAASTDGQLMPPIMGAAAFIIAEYVNVSYLTVVKAAVIPALASYFGLFCIAHLEASKLGIKGMPREELPRFWDTLKRGLHYLVPIGVLLYELVVVRHSPELAAYRAILALLAVIVWQEVRAALEDGKRARAGLLNAGRIILSGLARGSRNMIPVALACASAGIIVGIVGMGLGGMIAGVVEALSAGNIFILLFITAMACLLIGMGLPTTATYIVMASLTAPVIVEVGALYGFAVPLMAAHLFCFYFGILADDTPPVGLAAYAASAIAGSDPIRTGIQGFLYDIRTSCIAFMIIFNPELILHGINSWPQGLLILAMALIGMSAFECFAQDWCLIRNRWYEIPLFLAAWFSLLHPGGVAWLVGVDKTQRYWFFPLGILLYIAVIVMQKLRMRKDAELPAVQP